MLEVILKRFEKPDEVRTFEKGKFELVHIGGMTIGRASLCARMEVVRPRWPLARQEDCEVGHVGLVVSGRATAAMEDGTVTEMKAGDIFFIPTGPPGHDSWVVGDEFYASCTCSALTIIQPRKPHEKMKGTQSRDKCDAITIAATSAAREVGGLIRGKRISLVLSGGNVDRADFFAGAGQRATETG